MTKTPSQYIRHPEKWNAYQRERARARRADPLKNLFERAQTMARRQGEPWELSLSDITIPAFCPRVPGRSIVLGLPTCHALSPLLVRMDSTLGWVPGNVEVVARRSVYPKARGCPKPKGKAPPQLVATTELRPAQALRLLEAEARKAKRKLLEEKIKLLKAKKKAR